MLKDLGFNKSTADTLKTSLNLSSLEDIVDRDYRDAANEDKYPKLVKSLYTKDELEARKDIDFKLP
jgi:hypothetical protein